jgi:BASS family bile acid:Na+ symporter
MSIQTLIFLALNVSIFLAVLAVGMRVTIADLLYVLRRPSLLFRSLLAINVAGPIVAIVVCKTFSLHPAVIVALVALAIAPVSNIFTLLVLPLVEPGRAAYVRGLLFASTVLSVVVTPLSVEVIQLVFGGHVHVNPLAVIQVVVASMLLPLGIGLAIGRWWPAATRWVPITLKASMLVLLACAVPVVLGAWSPMTAVVRTGTITAIVVLTLVCLAAGHLLGGPDEDDRTTLAQAVVTRHPGVAIVVASLTDQPLAPLGVLLVLLVGAVAGMPYVLWRKRRHAGPPRGVGPPARVGV